MKQNEIIETEQFTAFLQDAIAKVTTEEDPLVLNEYKKLFKKTVPLTLRSYVAAFIAKNICTSSTSKFKGHKDRREDKYSSRDKRRFTEDTSKKEKSDISVEDDSAIKTKAPRVVIDEALASKIFVGIGRNRHVYPKDLVGLISQVAQIDRERIGLIRVLDNYSFVQLFTEDADKVIAALNDYEYRGRKLVVSFSRKKDDSEKDISSSEQGSSSILDNESSSNSYESTEEVTQESSSTYLV